LVEVVKKNYTKNIFLSLGSNLGDKRQHLARATELINYLIGSVEQTSPLYLTEAWGLTSQEDFINQVIKIRSALTPKEILNCIHQIEASMGRVRKEKWEPRIIDIDILYFDDQCINSPELVIPHPLLQERKFVLVPLTDLSPTFVHPLLHQTNEQLLLDCTDDSEIHLLKD
jgi:2-amino-4-hydroxy-6-hydroxymethyldihydropteridine diphosphokinase